MIQLCEITFINSASLDFAQVPLDGNTLFCGANGAGKTTILRAILFFYSANSKKLGINNSKKKTFSEYYFENLNSYIIYKYKNEHGVFYVVLYKTGHFTPIKFRFFSSYSSIDLKELFLDDGVAFSIDKVISNLRENNIKPTNTINTAKEYREILYGQNKDYKQFALIKANRQFSQIYKTISNIFINSKLDSDVIKKSLVSDIEDFIPINLVQIQSDINIFLEDIESIYEFEASKELVKSIIKSYNSFYIKEALLKEESKKLYSSYIYSSSQLSSISKECDTNKENKDTLLNKRKDIEKIYINKDKKLDNELNRIKDFIKESNKRLKNYQNIGIEKKIIESNKKEIYKSDIQNLETQIDLLKQKSKNESEKFERLIEDKKNSTNKLINRIDQNINNLKSKYFNKKQQEEKKKQNKIKKVNSEYEPNIKIYDKDLNKKAQELSQIKYNIKEIQSKEFLKDDISSLQKEVQDIKDKISTKKLIKEKKKSELLTLDNNITKIESKTKHDVDSLAFNYDRTKTEILQEIKKLKSKLDISEGSFLHFLEKNNFKRKDELTTILKSEILFSNVLNPNIVNESDTIYGLKLDIKKDNSFDKSYIKEQIVLKEKLLSQELKSFEKNKQLIINDEQKQIKSIYKDKKEINSFIIDDNKSIEVFNVNLIKKQNSLVDIKKESLKQKERELDILSDKLEKEENIFNDLKDLSENYKKEFENSLKGIKSNYTKIIKNYEKSELEEVDILNTQKNDLFEDLEEKLKELKKLKKDTLENNGIDTFTLEKKENERKGLKNKLDRIEQNQELIFGYKKDKEEYFDKTKDKKEEQKQYEKDILVLKNDYKKDLISIDKNVESLSSLLEKLNQEYQKYELNINEYEKIKSSNFYEKIQGYFDKDLKIEKYEDISNMQTILFNIDDECDKILKSLRSYLNQIFSKLKKDNVLNLNPAKSIEKEDTLNTAKEIKKFDDENQIKYFKNLISSRYSMSLSTYTTQITNLLDASGKIKQTISKINQNLKDLKNINVIQKVELRHENSDNKVVQILEELKDEYNNNSFVNEVNLFNQLGADDNFNNRILNLFKKLNDYLFEFNKKDFLDLEDSFVLEFRAIENGNDTGFVSVLDDIGSNGTDVMVKVMVYIAMLNLSKKSSLSNKNEDIYLHCILDEIGILSPKYLKELISFANSQKIQFLNGAPDEKIVSTYKRVYLLSTTKKHKTLVNEIVAQI